MGTLLRLRAALSTSSTRSAIVVVDHRFLATSTKKASPPPQSTTVTLEVRAGTGGGDASLFASELFRAYSRHAASRGWEWQELRRLGSSSSTSSSTSHSSSSASAASLGIKLASARISGQGVAELLRGEAGVHRVQRVPVTESSGRQHTSAATVAVLLPEDASINDVVVVPKKEKKPSSLSSPPVPLSFSSSSSSHLPLKPEDVRIDTMRSSGKGGQHANTTDSAVRAVHLPTQTAVVVRSGRSQHRNRARALAELERRLREVALEESSARVAGERKGQVGGGDRSEKVRTYNFTRGFVVDHRSGKRVVGDVESEVMSGKRLGEFFLVGE